MRKKSIISEADTTCEINVVPLLDVILVLLITFMISTPVMTSSVNVELPKTNTGIRATTSNDTSTIVVSLQGESAIFLTNTELGTFDKKHTPKSLVLTLMTIKKKQPSAKIYLRADKETPYKRIVFSLELIKSAGFNNANLVTDFQS